MAKFSTVILVENIYFLLLQVHHTTLHVAADHRSSFNQDFTRLVHKTTIVRCRKPKAIPLFIHKWIHDNTQPSSNSKNTVLTRVGGHAVRHVVHWRTEAIDKLYDCCQVEVQNRFGVLFKRTYFYNLLPSYVRIKKMQEGLCSTHHTGIELIKEFKRKQLMWHKNCDCDCAFCDPEQCDHGRYVFSQLYLQLSYLFL